MLFFSHILIHHVSTSISINLLHFAIIPVTIIILSATSATSLTSSTLATTTSITTIAPPTPTLAPLTRVILAIFKL
ncbi:hypothetical protein F4679DRAFT_562924 [Xylaria curta]|nr:hypothetical protein F4679DRAFT_562924 [Xylaria curta]